MKQNTETQTKGTESIDRKTADVQTKGTESSEGDNKNDNISQTEGTESVLKTKGTESIEESFDKLTTSSPTPPSKDISDNNDDEDNPSEAGRIYKKLTLEGGNRQDVEKFRQQYLNPKWEKILHDALESAIDYRLYVRKALQDNNMPPELEYLPVVESNYKTSAKSKSGAVGIWQFMENSVKPFLTLNDYVDERLDPWKETDAALKKLKDNYKIFGDWYLAIGAYNCGAGAMARALTKAKEKSFWYLADNGLIPSQTAAYVPKLLAIADLANNSEYYGIDIPDHEEEFNILYNEVNGLFDYITVSKAYSLNQLATEMRIDKNELKRLNPSFTKGFTHPSLKSTIRLPLGMEETASQALAKIKPIDFPVKYTVVAGDSLWSISRRYGTTVQAICELNGIKENAILKIGKILYIPSK